MKAASLMLCVVATRLPTSTRLPGPKNTPLPLLMVICPVALMRPKMVLASGPVTRLSVAPLPLLNCTWASLPTLKLCQLMTARWVLWSMTMLAPLRLMLAVPAATLPPAGKALLAVCALAPESPNPKAMAIAIARVVGRNSTAAAAPLRRLWGFLPAFPNSETTTNC